MLARWLNCAIYLGQLPVFGFFFDLRLWWLLRGSKKVPTPPSTDPAWFTLPVLILLFWEHCPAAPRFACCPLALRLGASSPNRALNAYCMRIVPSTLLIFEFTVRSGWWVFQGGLVLGENGQLLRSHCAL